MKFTFVVSALLVTTLQFAAQNVSESERRYQQAVRKQQIDGDLPAAIKLYQDIVASNSADRAIKAKALLGLASCFETQGKQAQAVYEQIIKEYGDQPTAVQRAHVKLAALRPPASPPTLTMRKIEFGAGVQNVVATDGQRAIYWDTTKHRLLIGDVEGKSSRLVFQADADLIPDVHPSRDLSMVLLHFPGISSQRPNGVSVSGLAVVKTDGTDYRDLSNGRTYPFLVGVSWSWDNRFALVQGSSGLLKISISDGQTSLVLRQPDMNSAQFSHDGRFIAFGKGTLQGLGLVYIMSSEGGEPRLVASNATLFDWTRDGNYLLIGESRSGSLGLSAVPIRNGQPAGEHIPIRATLPGSGFSQTTRSGTLVLQVNGGPTSQVYMGTLDANARVPAWKTLELIGATNRYGGYPAWSPDGRRIAYVERAPQSSTSIVRVRTLATNEDREVYRSNGVLRLCIWAAQRPALFCQELADDKTDVLSISIDSGRAEKIGSLDGVRNIKSVSPDDRILYTTRAQGWYLWEVGTNKESALGGFLRSPYGPNGPSVYWAFRGRGSLSGIVFRDQAEDPGRDHENDFRVLAPVRIPASTTLGPLPIEITRDGKWVVYQDRNVEGKDGFYRVSTSGGEPQRMGDYPTSNLNSMLLPSPDGRQFMVAVQGDVRPPEFWALENFLPALPSGPKPAKAATK